MTTQDGKHTVYRLQGAGDEREGVEIPMRLKDINGDPIESAGGGGFDIVLSVDFNGATNPTVTEVINNSGVPVSVSSRVGTGSYFITFLSPVFGDSPTVIVNWSTSASGQLIPWTLSVGGTAVSINTFEITTGAATDVTGIGIVSIKIND